MKSPMNRADAPVRGDGCEQTRKHALHRNQPATLISDLSASRTGGHKFSSMKPHKMVLFLFSSQHSHRHNSVMTREVGQVKERKRGQPQGRVSLPSHLTK